MGMLGFRPFPCGEGTRHHDHLAGWRTRKVRLQTLVVPSHKRHRLFILQTAVDLSVDPRTTLAHVLDVGRTCNRRWQYVACKCYYSNLLWLAGLALLGLLLVRH